MHQITTWDHSAVVLIRTAYQSPFGVKRLLANPQSTAQGFGYNLAQGIEADIQNLNLAKFFEDNPSGADEELADFLHTTIVDGRYLRDWLAHPDIVAQNLGVTISQDVFDRIAALNSHLTLPPLAGLPNRLVATFVGIWICLVLASKGPEYRVLEPDYLDRL